jgi:hypothetical protein
MELPGQVDLFVGSPTLLAHVVRLEVSDLPLKGTASFDHCPVRLALRCSAAAPTRARPDLSSSDRALSFLPGVRWDPDLAGDFQALVRAPEGRAELEEVVRLAEECISEDDAGALEAAVVKFQVALHRPLRAVMPHLAAGERKPRAIYTAEIATAKRAWRRELTHRRAGSHVHARRLQEYRRLLGRREKELALRSGYHAVAIARASISAFWKTCWRAEGRKANSVPGITLEQWHDYFRDLLGAPRRIRRDAAGAALAARAARGGEGGSGGAGAGVATRSGAGTAARARARRRARRRRRAARRAARAELEPARPRAAARARLRPSARRQAARPRPARPTPRASTTSASLTRARSPPASRRSKRNKVGLKRSQESSARVGCLAELLFLLVEEDPLLPESAAGLMPWAQREYRAHRRAQCRV